MSGIMQGTKQMLSQWQGVVLLGNRGWGLFHPPLPLEVSLWTQGLVCAHPSRAGQVLSLPPQ